VGPPGAKLIPANIRIVKGVRNAKFVVVVTAIVDCEVVDDDEVVDDEVVDDDPDDVCAPANV